jgi:hypothetical protein
MSKAKVAVLHGGLLARKGEARPLSTFGPPTGTYPTPKTQTVEALRPEPRLDGPAARLPQDPPVEREEPVVTRWQPEAPRAETSSCCKRKAELPHLTDKKPKRGGKRIELHARLDSVSHKRLRIAAAQLGHSQQEIVVAAIEAYLEYLEDETLNDCSCMQNARG